MPGPKTSHRSNLSAFQQIVQFCSAMGPDFMPTHHDLSLPSLQNKLVSAREAANQLNIATIQYKNMVGQRNLAAKHLRLLATRLGNAFLATGIPSAKTRYVRSTIARIQNNHNQSKKTEGKTKKRSQQSFAALAQLFQTLVNTLDAEPLYQVNEEQLKLTAVKIALDEFNTLCSQVITAKAACDKARLQRDNEFYHETTGMVTLAVKIKHYIRSGFGYSSPQFRQMARFQFD